MKYNQLYINAIINKFEYEISAAEANLNLYLSNSNISAVAEHTDYISEYDQMISKLAEAVDKFEIFKGFLEKYQDKDLSNFNGFIKE